MNILLFSNEELGPEGRVKVSGRRYRHIKQILNAQTGDPLRAGIVGGKMGEAKVIGYQGEAVELSFVPHMNPPKPLPLKIVMALPRPKVLKRVLSNVVSLGVKEIYLINAFRVEKPYWSSEQVTPDYIRRACLLGLEQARDTILPQIVLSRLFKPFVQDHLPAIIKGTRAFVGHPGVEQTVPHGIIEPITLVIGPEGGFIPYEIQLLKEAGVEPVTLGERVLKVETAITYLAGRFMS